MKILNYNIPDTEEFKNAKEILGLRLFSKN